MYETDEYIADKETLKRQKINLSIGLLEALLLFAMFGFIVFQRNKNKKLRYDSHQLKANEKIFSLIIKQQTISQKGKQEERERISEELHDGVLGRLFGTRLSLGFLGSSLNKEDLSNHNKLIDSLHDIEREIRDISHELKNEMFSSNVTFLSFVSQLVNEFKVIGGYDVVLYMEEDLKWDDLSDTIKINLYRILQESLLNTSKHAKATQVNIHFKKIEGNISLVIKDNGVGFKVRKNKRGIGQINMASRVKKLNGFFKLESEYNKGTTIEIILPIQN